MQHRSKQFMLRSGNLAFRENQQSSIKWPVRLAAKAYSSGSHRMMLATSSPFFQCGLDLGTMIKKLLRPSLTKFFGSKGVDNLFVSWNIEKFCTWIGTRDGGRHGNLVEVSGSLSSGYLRSSLHATNMEWNEISDKVRRYMTHSLSLYYSMLWWKQQQLIIDRTYKSTFEEIFNWIMFLCYNNLFYHQ